MYIPCAQLKIVCRPRGCLSRTRRSQLSHIDHRTLKVIENKALLNQKKSMTLQKYKYLCIKLTAKHMTVPQCSDCIQKWVEKVH